MPDKPRKVITSAEAAIREVGGAPFVADLFGIGPNAVRNWYKRGLPPETMLRLAPLLRAANCDFNEEKLFQQYPVASQPKASPPPKKLRGGNSR